MYTLARLYIKTALLFFLSGLALGFWVLVLRLQGEPAMMGVLISAHTHLVLFGFVIMLIMGVAYWMFPRPAKDDIRYSPKMAELNYWLITIGTVVRTFGELYYYMTAWKGAYALITIGAISQLLSGFVFSWNIWTRIRAIGSQHREAKGEKF